MKDPITTVAGIVVLIGGFAMLIASHWDAKLFAEAWPLIAAGTGLIAARDATR